MANPLEFQNDTTVYVFSTSQRLLRDVAVPVVALSCYVHGKAAQGEIGFECSAGALETRSRIVEGGSQYYGLGLELIAEHKDVIFSPVSPKWYLWKIVSQYPKKLCSDNPSDALPAGFEKRLRAMDQALDKRRREPNAFVDFANLHLDYGLEMQFWPYMTPYESVCYLFGSDTEALIEQVKCFFHRLQVPFYRIDNDRQFPIY